MWGILICLMSLSMGVQFCMLNAVLRSVLEIKGPNEPGYADFFVAGVIVGAALGVFGLVLQLIALSIAG